MVNALALVVFHWDEISHDRLLAWYFVMLLIATYRVTDQFLFKKAEAKRIRVAHWERRLLAGVIFAGVTAGGLITLSGNLRAISSFTLLLLAKWITAGGSRSDHAQ